MGFSGSAVDHVTHAALLTRAKLIPEAPIARHAYARMIELSRRSSLTRSGGLIIQGATVAWPRVSILLGSSCGGGPGILADGSFHVLRQSGLEGFTQFLCQVQLQLPCCAWNCSQHIVKLSETQRKCNCGRNMNVPGY